jgi:glutathione peroxidase
MGNYEMSVYAYSGTTVKGEEQSLSIYSGKVLLIVNTASKCGFTPQYKELQELYDRYKDRDFTILGFPSNQFRQQEPGSNSDIAEFCQINYGVAFPLFAKIDVKGAEAHPLFQYLTKHTRGFLTKEVKWNFTKFLVDSHGQVVRRYAPMTAPSKIANDIEKLLLI